MNLASIIDDHPEGHTALVAGGDRIGYGQLRLESDALRGALVELGLQPGDRVAIVCATNPRFVRSWLAVLGAGLVAVPLNPQSPALELERELHVVGARAVLVGPAGLTSFTSVDRTALPELEHVLAPAGVELDNSIDTEEAAASSAPSPVVARGRDDLAVLLFTSGTAGSPRAARLTHGNLLSNIRQMQAHPLRAVRADDVGLCVVPLHHVLGLNSMLDSCLFAGATLILVERFDPASFLDTIEEESVSLLAGPPTMWSAIVDSDPLPTTFASVRIAVSGASSLPDRVARAARERLSLDLQEGYGLTEASPSVTVGVGQDAPIGSIGKPIHDVEVRLVDEAGDDALIGDPGEIWVRGPNVFDGYWNDAEATARAVDADGWLHTGDIAVVDDDGFLYIVDRAKDLIIVSGFNVYPAEVEEALIEHSAVDDVGVIGVAHPHSGEAVKAYVVASGEVDEDELIEWCAGRLARYKCPTKVDIVDELPRSAQGKLLRRELAP